MFRITSSDPSSIAPLRTPARPVTETDRTVASPEEPGRVLLAGSFRAWVEGQTKADELVVGTRDPVVVPLELALRDLATSTQPLAPARGEALGLDDGATIGAAATLLLQACADPDGPRCRSYRSASYYLMGLALLDAGGEDTTRSEGAPHTNGSRR